MRFSVQFKFRCLTPRFEFNMHIVLCKIKNLKYLYENGIKTTNGTGYGQ